MAKFNEKNVYTGRARMRARDIRQALDGRNIDPAVIQTFEGLADNDKTLRDQIDALATLVDNCIDHISMLVAIIESVKNKVPDLDKLKDVSNVLSNSAREMVKGKAQEAIKMKEPEET